MNRWRWALGLVAAATLLGTTGVAYAGVDDTTTTDYTTTTACPTDANGRTSCETTTTADTSPPSSEETTTTAETYPTTEASTTTAATYPSSSSSSAYPTTTPSTTPSTSPPTTSCPPADKWNTTTTCAPSSTVPGSTTTTTGGSTTTGPPGVPSLFGVNVLGVCVGGTTPSISITFGNRPDLDGQTGTLSFTTVGGQDVGSVPLVFAAGQTVTIPYPATTEDVVLTYTLGDETATATVEFPENCTPATTAPGNTTTTLPGATTTTVPGSTTTTLPGTPPTSAPIVGALQIGSAASVCSRDVPFVDITFGNQPEFNGLSGTITFKLLDGTFVESHPLVYQANETVRLTYPGASFDPVTGEATDWPGWMLNADGFWVLDPSDQAFRDGLIVEASIALPPAAAPQGFTGLGRSFIPAQAAPGETVTATTTITYPPETAACNSPEGPFPGDTPSDFSGGSSGGGSIPVTGSDAIPLVAGAFLVLGGGGGLIWITRRRAARPRFR